MSIILICVRCIEFTLIYDARCGSTGNGPDFAADPSSSLLACIAPGAPGTTYGAKLHVFGPRNTQALLLFCALVTHLQRVRHMDMLSAL